MRKEYKYLLCLLLLHIPFILHGQTSFHWPDSRINLENYGYWERCLSVGFRTEDSTAGELPYSPDTFYYKNSVVSKSLPVEVVRSTKRCIQSIPLPAAASASIPLGLQIAYLLADDETKAGEVIELKLAGIEEKDFLLRAYTIDTAIENYVNARPARFNEAAKLYGRMLEIQKEVPAIILVRTIMKIRNAAWSAGDGDNFRLTALKIEELAKSMSDEEWKGQAGLELSLMYSSSIPKLYMDSVIKQLLVSTEAYKSILNEIFLSRTGRVDRSSEFYQMHQSGVVAVGDSVSSLQADFWFPSESKGSYPVNGKVTLVVPINMPTSDLWALATSLHRLKQKFSDINIVVVANTKGSFMDLEPPPPQQEAVLLDSLFRKFYKIPGIVAIVNTPSWRLPGYDKRRINEPTENEMNNIIGSPILIDNNGRAVYNGGISGHDEMVMEAIIRALTQRLKPTSADVSTIKYF